MKSGLEESRGGRRGPACAGRCAGLALLLALAFSFTGLGNHPLRASDEPRVAGIAWEMQHEGRWLVPRLGGVPFLEHPPLAYALLGQSIRHFGATDWAARFPSAVAGTATLLLVFALAARVSGPRAGLLALLTLISMRGFFRYSHKVLVDPLLALFVLCGYYAYVRAMWHRSGPERGSGERASAAWILAIYLAAACAFYVKGIVGVVAIAGPIGIDVLVGRRTRALRSLAHLAGIPVLVAACASWPLILAHLEGGTALREFLLQNVLYRFAPVEGAYRGGHVHGWAYYLPRLFEQVGWPLIFTPPLFVWLVRGNLPPGWNRSAVRFLAMVLPIGTALLSIPGTKRGLYLLPFLPPLAVAIGAWIDGVGVPTLARAAGPRERAAATWGARLVWIGFAGSVAWNLILYPLTNHERDLGPVSHEIDTRVGAAPLAGLQLPEEMRGALAFYTGRTPHNFPDASSLESHLDRLGDSFVLAPVRAAPVLDGSLGGALALQESWKLAEIDYALYEFSPGVAHASRAGHLRRGVSGRLRRAALSRREP